MILKSEAYTHWMRSMGSKEIVYVQWVDSQTNSAWEEEKDLNGKFHTVEAVGFLIKKSKDGIVIGLGWDEELKSSCCTMDIPKGCILKIKKMEAVDE